MTTDKLTAMAAEMVSDGRLWLRKTAGNLDLEIQQTLAACLFDLKRVGIEKISNTDPLICQAAKLYLKAHHGFNEDSEKFLAAYEGLRDALSLSGEYTTEVKCE